MKKKLADSNWTKTSMGLAIFGFINMVLFITLSSPVGTLFDMIDDQAVTHGVDSQVSPLLDNFRTIFGLAFVLSMFGLAVWFFLGSHKFEYEQY